MSIKTVEDHLIKTIKSYDEGQELHALVVDDEPQIIELHKGLLKRMGRFGRIHTALDPLEAMRKIQNNQYDIYIIDLNLVEDMSNEFNGMWLAHHMVLELKIPPERIVICSGNVDASNVILAFEVGVKNIITKPFSTLELQKKIWSVI